MSVCVRAYVCTCVRVSVCGSISVDECAHEHSPVTQNTTKITGPLAGPLSTDALTPRGVAGREGGDMGPSLGSKLASLEAGVGEGGMETVRELSNLGGTGGVLVPLRKGKVGSHVSIFGNGVGFARQFTEWRIPIARVIFAGHFPQKNLVVSGHFAESDLQEKAFYGSSPPYIKRVRLNMHVCRHTHAHTHAFVHAHSQSTRLPHRSAMLWCFPGPLLANSRHELK